MVRKSEDTHWPSLLVALAITFAAAGVGSRFPPGDWYRGLAKPSFNPPDAVFGPVWTAFYFLMALAAWLVWRRRGTNDVTWALSAYVVQLALNAAWSWLFFGRHQIGWALVDITLLWIAILVTVVLFWRVSRAASFLLVPYLAWVSFAAVLNMSFWRLNG